MKYKTIEQGSWTYRAALTPDRAGLFHVSVTDGEQFARTTGTTYEEALACATELQRSLSELPEPCGPAWITLDFNAHCNDLLAIGERYSLLETDEGRWLIPDDAGALIVKRNDYCLVAHVRTGGMQVGRYILTEDTVGLRLDFDSVVRGRRALAGYAVTATAPIEILH